MAHFLVTGAIGFIGSHLVQRLLDLNHKVTGLDNFSTGQIENISFLHRHKNSNFKLIKRDIRDFDACEKVCQGVDYVLHQAALGSVPRSINEPILYAENNGLGTLNMLEAARQAKVRRFVFASSSSVYGENPSPKIETMQTLPKSPYAISKVTGELYCQAYSSLYDLPTIILRYFNVFGQRQDPDSEYSAVIPKFIKEFSKNIPPMIYGDGRQTRDFTYIDNVVKANLNSCYAAPECFGKIFNVGCSKSTSIRDITIKIRDLIGSKIHVNYDKIRKGDVKHSQADISLARWHLDYKNLISFDEGLKRTIVYYS